MAAGFGNEVTAMVRSAMIKTRAAYRPAPSLFFYPGLTARPWWGQSDFPWLKDVVSQREVMLKEYQQLIAKVPSDYSMKSDEHKLHKGDWDWHSAVTKGILQPSFQLLCPETSALLQNVPGLLTDGVPFAYTFFSTLKPGARIAAHYGPCNLRVRIHIPLSVPSEDAAVCGIRVAGTTKAWKEGEALVFDDSYEHETWNEARDPRVILLVDVWHPDMSENERAGVRQMFQQARQQGWIS